MTRCNVFWIVFFLLVLVLPDYSFGRTVDYCWKCHTMHNSQGSEPIVTTTVDAQQDPQTALLNTNCVGCHIGTNSGATVGRVTPYVLTTTGVDYGTTGTEGNTLAGGNFIWVQSFDSTGHNVVGIADEDLTHGTTPPGGSGSAQLKCAGEDGCHGDRSESNEVKAIFGSHHSDSDLSITGTTIARSYRFLSGITGYEDSVYEFLPTASRHNQYKGKNRSPGDGDTDADTSTISHFCSRCHGDFHHGASTLGIADATFASPWIRHPTDFDLSDATGSEYGSYNKSVGSNAYSTTVPLASVTVTTSLSSVLGGSGTDAIVMCLSCHRAHGSQFGAILRWKFKKWPGPTGYNGCGVCHTSKD
ncbi:cytochrome c3 family protein [Thermodesulfobacteriota bacterium]